MDICTLSIMLCDLFQMQCVRLVSTPSTGSTNVVTVGKSKVSTTLQTVGIGQKIGNQQQIVKVYENLISISFSKTREERKSVYCMYVFYS